MSITRGLVVGLTGFSLLLASCGGDDPGTGATTATVGADDAPADDAGADAATAAGFSSISAQDAAALTEDPPANLVVLDVRTPEEFAQGHLDGAVLVDFYDPAFAEQLGALDPDVPYLVYCKSGNRSGQTLPIMEELGFTSAVDVDGGIQAWAAAGLPIVAG